MKNPDNRRKEIDIITITGSIVNAALLGLKFFAGFFGHSSAMIADAFHSLSDFITDIVVLVFMQMAGKPRDTSHDYGHGKFETLATAVIGFMLFMVGAGIFRNGAALIWTYLHGAVLEEPGKIAFIMALVSIVSKELLYQWTYISGKKVNSAAVMANAWHHRSDAFSSIATAVGIAGAIFLGEKWRVLDPITACGVGGFIIIIGVRFIKTSFDELLEKSLPYETEEMILSIIRSFPEIHDPHNLRTRRIGSNIAIEVHIRFNRDTTLESAHAIATLVEDKLKGEFGDGTHVVTHMEC
ncbi:MAG: cation diffusion facilitator family transporter [Treponema sp.]|jgi:cation diffusion facilitator family transporter|nr:cation diffusion facilitator family transporter [Treponema sp.]